MEIKNKSDIGRFKILALLWFQTLVSYYRSGVYIDYVLDKTNRDQQYLLNYTDSPMKSTIIADSGLIGKAFAQEIKK